MANANVRVPSIMPGEGGAVALTTTSARTAAGHPVGSTHAWVWADAASYVVVGSSSVTAGTSDMPIPANAPVFIRIVEGQYIAARTITGTGNLYYAAMTY